MGTAGYNGDVQREFPRILCVDDEPHILDSLRDTLHRKFDVTTATSGPEGLERVLEIPLLRLRAGMMLADDVRSVSGPLLIARGHVATEQLMTRLWNLGEAFVREPLLVVDQAQAVPDAA